MAWTLTVEGQIPGVSGANFYYGNLSAVGDTSYPTGGEVIDAVGDVGYLKMWFTPTAGAYVAGFDRANQKIKLAWNGDATPAVLPEVTNASDQNAARFDFLAIGP